MWGVYDRHCLCTPGKVLLKPSNTSLYSISMSFWCYPGFCIFSTDNINLISFKERHDVNPKTGGVCVDTT